MTQYSIKDIAAAIGAHALGDTDLLVDGVAEPQDASAETLAMAMDGKYADMLAKGSARAAVLWDGADWQAMGLAAAIIPSRPRYAMAGITALMDRGQGDWTGVHPSAVIDPSADLGPGVAVGPLAVIAAGARIGAGSVIGPQSYVGPDAVLGEDCLLREQVSMGARVTVGDRVIVQPGARIGGDGFSFVTPDRSGIEAVRETLGDKGDTEAQSYARIHSLGAVTLGADVEVGANSTIDNGTIRDTMIGAGTKIDSLVQIGHNVVVGRDCLICGQAGVAGSAKIGNHVVLGGRVAVNDNIFVGDGVIAGGAAKLRSNVPAGRVVLGDPATKMETQIEIFKAMRRLPRMVADVAALKKAVFKSGSSD